MSIDVPPGPGCSPGRLPLLSPTPKRSRVTVCPTQSAGTSGAAPAPRPFTPNEVASLAQHVPKRLKRVAERVASGEVSLAERIFNVLDVRDIVESVLSERESKLKEEYTKLLNERLAEQFRDFTKFNEDYVSRQYRSKDCPYLS